MSKLGLMTLQGLRSILPKANSGFTKWNLFFYSILTTGIFPQLYPIIFCTTWGIFISFNVAPLLDRNAFRNLAKSLNVKSMPIFHLVYNLAAHGLPCVFTLLYPPHNMRWWSGIIGAGLHLLWGAVVTKGSMLLNDIYIPLRPEFWALMWSSAVFTEIGAPFMIYPLIWRKDNESHESHESHESIESHESTESHESHESHEDQLTITS